MNSFEPLSKEPVPEKSQLGDLPKLRKLPIGIQDFASLRKDGYLYVDKTQFVYNLVNQGRVFFLSRPRRFGKSLLCSTISAYFEGKKELFQGLAMESLEHEWLEYPVLRLDLNAEKYDSPVALERILNRHLMQWEQQYGCIDATQSLAGRFVNVIRKAKEKTDLSVVVIVDEYDKPLLSALENPTLSLEYKTTLKAFYGALKSADSWLKFAFLTGVTKFGQVSVFSDLNQLQDISLHPNYATLCGITEPELLQNFAPELQSLAKVEQLDFDQCLQKVRKQYNGYKFHFNAEGVFNPFSTLNLFSTLEFRDYWFQTGTPTFLVELLKKANTDLRDIDGVQVPVNAFADYIADLEHPLSVIYQSGYLTIHSYDPELRFYTLVFPNDEVRYGFLGLLRFCASSNTA
jgi:hypothetical protein